MRRHFFVIIKEKREQGERNGGNSSKSRIIDIDHRNRLRHQTNRMGQSRRFPEIFENRFADHVALRTDHQFQHVRHHLQSAVFDRNRPHR